MNVFTANCPHCGAALQVQHDWIGMEIPCPSCNQSFVLPPPGPMPAVPFWKNVKIIIPAAAAALVLLVAGISLFFLLKGILYRFPDSVVQRERLMLLALDLSDKKKPTDQETFERIKEKARKTNNPDLFFPVGWMEIDVKSDRVPATLAEGIRSGSGGCIYFIFNVGDKAGYQGVNVVEKAVEIKYWPAIVKAGMNTKIVSMLRDEELSPDQSKLVSLCDDFLKNGKTQVSIKGNMRSARGSFLIFEDKVCYFPINKEKPANMTVNGKEWKNPAFPFVLDQKVYPCLHGKNRAKVQNIELYSFWLDSISLYPKLDSEFEFTADLVKK